MELTRRDALAALTACGLGGAGVALLDRPSGESEFDDHQRSTLAAIARVVYPSAVTGVESFVETYSLGRTDDFPEYRRGMATALAELDEHATEWYDELFVDMSPAGRDRLLREMGVDAASPDPRGTTAERVRYYLVNDLLYALYTTPTGGELVGIENPQGHPGGLATYRRGPQP